MRVPKIKINRSQELDLVPRVGPWSKAEGMAVTKAGLHGQLRKLSGKEAANTLRLSYLGHAKC